jgi:hypothetical protein
MRISPELIAAVVFGVIMVIIGLAAIWIVHWQTHVLLRQQRKDILTSATSAMHVLTMTLIQNWTSKEHRGPYQTPGLTWN